MDHTSYGAIVHGRQADAASTVEPRTVNGARIVALIAVRGDLATPSLESLKGAFVRLAQVTQATDASKIASAAPPPPYASGVAVVLIVGDQAHVASKGSGCCYRERDGALQELEPGTHELRAGDVLIASSHQSLVVDRPFFTKVVETVQASPATEEFRNDELDDALASALEGYTTSAFAVSAARIA